MTEPATMSGIERLPFCTVFDEGIYAYAKGDDFLDNPYLETNLTSARIWFDGYVVALIAHREAKP